MARAAVNFLGICTHFRLIPPPDPPHPGVAGGATWRAVLVNASDPNTITAVSLLRGLHISPHVARLAIPERQVVDIKGPLHFTSSGGWRRARLEGVTPTFANDVETALTVDPSMACIPSLSHLESGALPGPAVTTTDPHLAACHFDISGGTLYGTVLNDAGVTLLELETRGDPVLLISPWHGDPTRVTLRPLEPDEDGHELAALVVVMNYPLKGGDRKNPYDINLHFLAANRFPASAVTLKRLGAGCKPNPYAANLHNLVILTESVGCSNSGPPHP